MAAIIFSGVILGQTLRVVDRGAATNPRLVVESRQADDAMGVPRWAGVDPITREVFEGLLIAAHVVV